MRERTPQIDKYTNLKPLSGSLDAPTRNTRLAWRETKALRMKSMRFQSDRVCTERRTGTWEQNETQVPTVRQISLIISINLCAYFT